MAESPNGAFDHERVKELLHSALACEPPLRDALLRDACGGDTKLHARVTGLLAAHEAAGTFLSPTGSGIRVLPHGAGEDPGLAPGATIGPYRLVRRLGEGGFGEVYLAEQQRPVARRVALKILKPGMDTEQVTARFEVERQALALMDHPHIARVLDAGTTPQGRPYFAMEYVAGEPITVFCDRRQLDLRARLVLFEQVCGAVQHAHHKGVIHRDLKPTNVLVTVIDGRATPKVIDFGIAKATGSRLTDRTLVTRHILGTPEYMSPEQAATAEDIDTRTDVYSLGVMLYELLCGRSPYDRERFASAGVIEAARMICEEEPPRPSLRFARAGDEAAAIAAARLASPARVQRMLAGELDWIVLRAIEKDRARRYATPVALGDDVLRYLHDEPVQAGPPSTWYRLRKAVRRHRGLTIALCVAAVALVSAAAVSIGAAFITLRANTEARASEALAARESYTANLFAAQAALADHDPETARTRLMSAPERLRGFEWSHFRGRLDRSEASFRRSRGRALAVVASRDGRVVACLWEESVVCILDGASGRALGEVACGPQSVRSIALDHGGTRVFAGTESGDVLVIDVRRLAMAPPLRGHGGAVESLAVSSDGALLASASLDGSVRLWDTATGALARVLHGGGAELDLVALGPGGRHVAASGFDQRLWLWDLGTADAPPVALRCARPATEDVEPARFANGRPSAIAFSPDERILITGARDGRLAFWSLPDAGLLLADDSHYLIRALAVSGDGSRVAAASADRTTSLWRLPAPARIATLRAHTDDVRHVAFSGDGLLLATSCFDRSLRLWNADNGQLRSTLLGHDGALYGAAFLGSGARLVTWSGDGTVRWWNPRARHLDTLAIQPHHVAALAFLDESRLLVVAVGRQAQVVDVAGGEPAVTFATEEVPVTGAAHAARERIAIGTDDGRVLLFDVHGQKLATLSGHRGRVVSVAFAPDGRVLASASLDGTARLWDCERAAELRVIERREQAMCAVAFDPAGERIATAGDRGPARLWSAGTGALLREFPSDAGTSRLAFDPQGRTLAVSGDRGIRLLRLDGRSPARELLGHGQTVSALAWLPDGSRVVSISRDRSVRLWDPIHGENVGILGAHDEEGGAVAVSPSGRIVASGGEDRLVRLWALGD